MVLLSLRSNLCMRGMRERLQVFLYIVLFWFSFMIISRALFLLYNHSFTAQLTTHEIFLTFTYGLRMDASICGYFLAFTGLMLSLSAIVRAQWVYYTFTVLTIALLLFCAFVVIVDLELYHHWGFRLNSAPIFYMNMEGLESAEPAAVVKVLAIMILLAGFFIWVYFRFIAPYFRYLGPATYKSAIVFLIITGLMFIPIRGSFTVAPMNTGFVFFHKSKTYANHTAINVVWNFLYSLQTTDVKYPENFYDKAGAGERFASLYPASDSTIQLLNTQHPNIILIIIESFTADVIEPLGGMKGIAPNLSSLCKEGILFDNFYASGDRTDKGLIGILSGYPAQPLTSIIKYPAKTQHLPSLNISLKKLGYNSSFIYGGDVNFANFRSYLTGSGFDHITAIEDFQDVKNISKWGVHDHFMLEQAIHELDTTRTPFFKTILTLSSHEPFDVPMTPYIKGDDTESLFLNACHYTDKSLGNFIASAKQKPWWNNTLIILTADHGHRLPGDKELTDTRRFKIPLLMLGGAIRKDTVIHTLSGQTDIANTLLAQLGHADPAFKFSKNILGNKVIPFTAYFYNDGFGFLLPGKQMMHDNPGKNFIKTAGNPSAEDINTAKAYMQTLYSDYNQR